MCARVQACKCIKSKKNSLRTLWYSDISINDNKNFIKNLFLIIIVIVYRLYFPILCMPSFTGGRIIMKKLLNMKFSDIVFEFLCTSGGRYLREDRSKFGSDVVILWRSRTGGSEEIPRESRGNNEEAVEALLPSLVGNPRRLDGS